MLFISERKKGQETQKYEYWWYSNRVEWDEDEVNEGEFNKWSE